MQPCVLQFSEEGQSLRLSVVVHRCVLFPTLLEELEDAASLNQPRIRYLGKLAAASFYRIFTSSPPGSRLMVRGL